jgi:hypothetical protein
MLNPSNFLTEIRTRDDIHFPIAIDIEWGVREVLVVLRIRAGRDITYLMLGPRGSRVPGISTEDVQLAIAIEVSDSDSLEGGPIIDDMLLPCGGFIRVKRRSHRGTNG